MIEIPITIRAVGANDEKRCVQCGSGYKVKVREYLKSNEFLCLECAVASSKGEIAGGARIRNPGGEWEPYDPR